MANFDLYIDVVANEIVLGSSNTQTAAFPRLVQGDTISLRIYLLARNSTWPQTNPYNIINNSALSLKVALGPKNGTAGSTLYTQQFTWARDATSSYFYADFPLNTAAIGTLIGSAESAAAWFEVEYTQNGFPTTVLQKSVNIQAEVIETGTITVPPGLTAMSAEEANSKFLQRKISGAFYLEDINNAGTYIAIYCEDGALKAEPVTGTLP